MAAIDHTLVRFIDRVRSAHPDMRTIFMEGQCYNFFLILREIRREAEAWYSMFEGHVYVRIGACFYDIRGAHLRVPRDTMKLCHRSGDRPHRWGRRDRRRLFDQAIIARSVERPETSCSTSPH